MEDRQGPGKSQESQATEGQMKEDVEWVTVGEDLTCIWIGGYLQAKSAHAPR